MNTHVFLTAVLWGEHVPQSTTTLVPGTATKWAHDLKAPAEIHVVHTLAALARYDCVGMSVSVQEAPGPYMLLYMNGIYVCRTTDA